VRQFKRVLREILFSIPWGKCVYRRLYVPLVARAQARGRGGQVSELQKPTLNHPEQVLMTLRDLVVLEEEWADLLREAAEHFEFLRQFLAPPDGSEEAAQATLEEFRRHLAALILVFRSLLARQETQLAFARGLVQKGLGQAPLRPGSGVARSPLAPEDKPIPLLQKAKDDNAFLRDSLRVAKEGDVPPELPPLDREAMLEKVVEYLVNMQGDDPPP